MAARPPTGSKPIDETEWSGDHQTIEEYLGLTPIDRVYIDPRGNVWAENPNGSWSNHGLAADYAASGRARARGARDRER
jgi:hypothetical protein